MQDAITSEVMPANKVTKNVIISFTPRLFSFQDPDPAFCHRTLNNSILTQLFSKTQSSFTGICIDFKKRYCAAARRRLCNIFFILTLFLFHLFQITGFFSSFCKQLLCILPELPCQEVSSIPSCWCHHLSSLQ